MRDLYISCAHSDASQNAIQLLELLEDAVRVDGAA